MNLFAKILEQKVFYVIRNQDYNVAQKFCEMLINLQVTCLELTFTIPKVELLIKTLRKKYPSILIGAGTVLTLTEAMQAAEAGAQFLVGPIFNRAISDFCHRKGLIYIPGAMTLQEVTNIVNADWEIIKIFPATAFKLNFIQTIKTFFPNKIYMASGGIDLTNLKEAKALGYDLIAVGTFVTGNINNKIIEQEKIQTIINTINLN
ncbi:bifunctional 4-hydroxy-2-oxoglutarate aldolase/2-dehydro-3-deoxy-phosphogluconate aldolase [Spiroplasma sp. SV19]|uniref:bifunctional 4-hydroxy-2-oxoglutarate aldolase/2-dehydro-3-deoxy-phosphogluconate aldolase n=1 Tax=Spiroplasma sp. SV19 TaxID=2570468 RepID=UPI0024B7FBD0|nr:bifunctional 4-hydroxy-2-oxoglutarate aldolase/2-dehydro-3-deoxy-phosphogluconate aldolase [Spiroplasma sp. SV19]WHQ36634.1 2-dehydro-3-deoxyphosphogluconate aldolase [Spiroplasma sp. SV19]